MISLKNPLKNKHAYSQGSGLWWAFFAFVGAFFAILIGYFYSIHISNKIDQQERANLLTTTQTIALLTNGTDIEALMGNDSDLTSAAYLRVKQTLYNLHDINNGSRFVYYMRSDTKSKKLMFLADSESPDSKDYSPPGQVYEDTSELEMTNYINATPFVEGPYTDQWGTWVSAYAPIWLNGKLIAVFGMDVSADKWEANDHRFQKGIFAIAILAVLWFVLLGSYIRQTVLYSRQTKEMEASVVTSQ